MCILSLSDCILLLLAPAVSPSLTLLVTARLSIFLFLPSYCACPCVFLFLSETLSHSSQANVSRPWLSIKATERHQTALGIDGWGFYLVKEEKSLSCVWLFATLWTIAHQAPLSMEFSGQEFWSGLPFSSPGDLPDSGIKSRSPALQADSSPSEILWPPYQEWLIQLWFIHALCTNALHMLLLLFGMFFSLHFFN